MLRNKLSQWLLIYGLLILILYGMMVISCTLLLASQWEQNG